MSCDKCKWLLSGGPVTCPQTYACNVGWVNKELRSSARSEQTAHNRRVVGSNPTGATTLIDPPEIDPVLVKVMAAVLLSELRQEALAAKENLNGSK